MPYARATYIPAVPAQFLTNAGAVAAGYKLFVYLAATTTKTTTYTDSGLAAANTHPIVLDSAGRATIFLAPSVTTSYKFVLATPTTADPPAGGDIVWTRDSVAAQPNADANVDILGKAGEVLISPNAVALDEATGKWFKTDPALTSRSIDAPRLGFVLAGGSTNEVITVRLSGLVEITGLAVGSTYYLDTTAGAISPTPPTGANHIVPVGFTWGRGRAGISH